MLFCRWILCSLHPTLSGSSSVDHADGAHGVMRINKRRPPTSLVWYDVPQSHCSSPRPRRGTRAVRGLWPYVKILTTLATVATKKRETLKSNRNSHRTRNVSMKHRHTCPPFTTSPERKTPDGCHSRSGMRARRSIEEGVAVKFDPSTCSLSLRPSPWMLACCRGAEGAGPCGSWRRAATGRVSMRGD